MRVTVESSKLLQKAMALFMDRPRYLRCMDAQLTRRGIAVVMFVKPIRVVYPTRQIRLGGKEPASPYVEKEWQYRAWFSSTWKSGRPFWWRE